MQTNQEKKIKEPIGYIDEQENQKKKTQTYKPNWKLLIGVTRSAFRLLLKP